MGFMKQHLNRGIVTHLSVFMTQLPTLDDKAASGVVKPGSISSVR